MVKKIGVLTGTILIILTAIFTFSYFEIKKIERLSAISPPKKPEVSLPPQKPQKEKRVPLASPAPGSDFIIPEAPLFESKKVKPSLAKKAIHLPILMYHHINYLPPNASKVYQALTVNPATFEKQMNYLSQEGYQPITFEKFLSLLKIGKEIPKKSLIITFDDGWKNQYQNAFPVLKKYKFPATFFVVVNYIGGSNFMDWKELKELLKAGMEIGSHTIDHPNLRGLSEKHLKYEVQNSKIILEKGLGQKIIVFDYPYGAFDSKVIKAVKDSNYLAARTCISGVDQDPENMYTLKAIQVDDNLYQFKKIFPPEE